MGDIDFDELDRAVNSLMDQTGPANNTANADAKPAQTQPQSQNDPIDEVAGPPVVAATSAAVSARSSSSTPAVGRRVGGRFMDVIPSTGSQRPIAARPAPSAVASRESASLQPVRPSDKSQDDTSVADYFEDSANDDISQDYSMKITSNDPAPLSSPFLEGIEIDKRPLGAPATEPDYSDMSPQDSASNELNMPDPIDFAGESMPVPDESPAEPWASEADIDHPDMEEPLRPELSPEVLAVETMALDGSSASAANSAQPVSMPTPTSGPKAAWGSDVQPPPTPALDVVAPAPAPAPAPVASLSGGINPQYSSVPADTPEPSAVFDAASEAPVGLNHPQKKKTGWSIVLWILLMVVVGVAAGVAVWYFLVK